MLCSSTIREETVSKRKVVERALAGDERLPIARLLARMPAPAHIYWME